MDDPRVKCMVMQYWLNMYQIVNRFNEEKRKRRWKFLQQIIGLQNLMITSLTTILPSTFVCNEIPKKRSIWMKKRSSHWWTNIVLKEFADQDWIESFRMKKDTFTFICEELREVLKPDVSFLQPRKPISVEKQVALTLYYLAHCCEYTVIGNMFGIHKTSVWRCIHRVVNAIVEVLLPLWIRMPNQMECDSIASNYEAITHIRQVIGAIDAIHVPILPPANISREYMNKKGWSSIVLQGVVDDSLRFRNIYYEASGFHSHASVLKESDLYKENDHLMPQKTKTINNIEVPYVLMGNSAYPLLPWLLKPYTSHNQLTPQEESFNVYLEMGRVHVETAFTRLRARWQCIVKRSHIHLSFVPYIVAASCVLHNIVEAKEEKCMQEWIDAVEAATSCFPQPKQKYNRSRNIPAAVRIRNALRDHVSQFPMKTFSR